MIGSCKVKGTVVRLVQLTQVEEHIFCFFVLFFGYRLRRGKVWVTEIGDWRVDFPTLYSTRLYSLLSTLCLF